MEKFYTRNRQKTHSSTNVQQSVLTMDESVNGSSPPDYPPPPPPSTPPTEESENVEDLSILSSDRYYLSKHLSAKSIGNGDEFLVSSSMDYHEPIYEVRAVRSPAHRTHNVKRNSYYDDSDGFQEQRLEMSRDKSLNFNRRASDDQHYRSYPSEADVKLDIADGRIEKSSMDYHLSNSNYDEEALDVSGFNQHNHNIPLDIKGYKRYSLPLDVNSDTFTSKLPSTNKGNNFGYSPSTDLCQPYEINPHLAYLNERRRKLSKDRVEVPAKTNFKILAISEVEPSNGNSIKNSVYERLFSHDIINGTHSHDSRNFSENPNIGFKNQTRANDFPHNRHIPSQLSVHTTLDNESRDNLNSMSYTESALLADTSLSSDRIYYKETTAGKSCKKYANEENMSQDYIERYTCRYDDISGCNSQERSLTRSSKLSCQNIIDKNTENKANKYQRSRSIDAISGLDCSDGKLRTSSLKRRNTNPFLRTEEIDLTAISLAPHKFLPEESSAEVPSEESDSVVDISSMSISIDNCTTESTSTDDDFIQPPVKDFDINALSKENSTNELSESSGIGSARIEKSLPDKISYPSGWPFNVGEDFSPPPEPLRDCSPSINSDVPGSVSDSLSDSTTTSAELPPRKYSSNLKRATKSKKPTKTLKKRSSDGSFNKSLNLRKSLPNLLDAGCGNDNLYEENSQLESKPALHGSLPLLDQIQCENDMNLSFQDLVKHSCENIRDTKRSTSTLDIAFEPGVVLKQLKRLLDSKKYPQAVAFVERLPPRNLTAILPSLSLNDVVKHFPECLSLIAVIFEKIGLILYPSDFTEFPIKGFDLDVLIKQFIKYLAKINDPVRGCDLVVPPNFSEDLNNVLKVLVHFNPKLKTVLYKRKRTLERCLTGLAKHGYVPKADGKLVNLHEAFKSEITKQFQIYKTALPKLENIIPRTPQKSSKQFLSSLSMLPPEASHQRMLNFTQKEVEDRLIKNQSVYRALESFGHENLLRNLIMQLEERIQCDKYILLHYNELKKQMRISSKSACLAPVFQNYATSFGKLIDYIQEVAVDDGSCGEDVCDAASDSDIDTWDTASCVSSAVLRERSSSSSAPTLRGNIRSSVGYSSLDPEKRKSSNSAHGKIDVNGLNPGASGSTLSEQTDIETLRNEVILLKKELIKTRQLTGKLEAREKLLKERLSEKAQHNVQCGSTFEDLSLGDSRPTQLIRRYSNLYSQTRVDALDALDSNQEISEFDDLKVKLLFSVVVLAFRAAQETLDELKQSVRQLLNLPSPDDPPETHTDSTQEMEENILMYLRKATERFDYSKIVDTISKQLWATLYDYPSLRELSPLLQYIEECAQVAWALVIQNPPFSLDYESTVYNDSHHTRFIISDSESEYIDSFLWPTLLEHENGPCVFKGVVVT